MRVAEKIGITFVGDNAYSDGPCKSYVMTAASLSGA